MKVSYSHLNTLESIAPELGSTLRRIIRDYFPENPSLLKKDSPESEHYQAYWVYKDNLDKLEKVIEQGIGTLDLLNISETEMAEFRKWH